MFFGDLKLLLRLTIVNALRFCTLLRLVCARLIFSPCKQVVHTFEKSSVYAVAGLKARFMSLFI